ncbi:MAG: SET domain-containing protein-lysine N-methyltransferase [Bacteroidota bacterium]
MLHIPGLYITVSEGRGRGVFTAVEINKGDIIEYCPLIVIPPTQRALIDQTIFYDYYYNWPQPAGAACLPLGYGSIYNHSEQPNAEIVLDLEGEVLQFYCLKYTPAGEEIFVDYTGGEEEKELWFRPV